MGSWCRDLLVCHGSLSQVNQTCKNENKCLMCENNGVQRHQKNSSMASAKGTPMLFPLNIFFLRSGFRAKFTQEDS